MFRKESDLIKDKKANTFKCQCQNKHTIIRFYGM